jgi:hypothetical protein
MRRSRRVRSNRLTSRRVYANKLTEGERTAIGKSFATKQRAPLMGRVKRMFDLPSQSLYFGEKAYPAKFGAIPQGDADDFALQLFAVDPERERERELRRRGRAPVEGAQLAQNSRRSRRRRLHSNTLIRGVGQKAVSTKLSPAMYQLVETTEDGRMWHASYPITVASYMTTGYLRDFKLGGIAKRKAKMAPGTRIEGGTKRKDARNIPDTE